MKLLPVRLSEVRALLLGSPEMSVVVSKPLTSPVSPIVPVGNWLTATFAGVPEPIALTAVMSAVYVAVPFRPVMEVVVVPGL